MINKPVITFFAMAAALSGCSGNALGQPNKCALFISNLQEVAREDRGEFNIEKLYQLEGGLVTEAYESATSISSGCNPVELHSVSPASIMGSWDVPSHIDISAGVHAGSPWIEFIYPSIDNEHGSGLASSIVFYDRSGIPQSTMHVSSYHSWEGARVTSSRIAESKLEKCTQSIEFYSYTNAGDIDEVLAEPIRSRCEYSYEDLP